VLLICCFIPYMNSVLHILGFMGRIKYDSGWKVVTGSSPRGSFKSKICSSLGQVGISNLLILVQVSFRNSCSFSVSVSFFLFSHLFEGRGRFMCLCKVTYLGKNLSFYFPCAAVFLCTTFRTCTIMSWFLRRVSWTGRRRLWFLRCLALILFRMFNCNHLNLYLFHFCEREL